MKTPVKYQFPRTDPKANTYRFSSKEVDWRTGQYYYGYRYYDPNLQRWLNHDPIGERGGINLYRFVENNPVNRVDPLGLAPSYGNPISGPNGPVGDGLPPEQPMLPPQVKSPSDYTPSTPQEKLGDIQKAQRNNPTAIRCIAKSEQNDKASLRQQARDASKTPTTPAVKPATETPPVEPPPRYVKFVNPATGETTFKEIGGEDFGSIADDPFDELFE
jgi:RHS repeat-associated protein